MNPETYKILEEAVEAHAEGNLSKAEELYHKVLAAEPASLAARFLLGQVSGFTEALNTGKPGTLHLFETFQKYQNHYYAGLPYNLNWMLSEKEVAPFDEFLRKNPLALFDIGARGGAKDEMTGLRPHTACFAFDADKNECDKLRENPPKEFLSFNIFPYYIGKTKGPTAFHMYKGAGDSSRLTPNKRFKEQFKNELEISKTISIEGETLDGVIEKEGLPDPDFIKLDVQGTELEILGASPRAVAKTCLIETEVTFAEMYEGQALFHDMARHLYEQGFELLYLNRVFQERTAYQGETRGQITFGDALFGRREDKLKGFGPERVAKFALLLINYGHLDFAQTLWNEHPEIRELAPGLAAFFAPHKENSTRILNMAYDKMLCWMLHRRRTNQIESDSDRSWPFR